MEPRPRPAADLGTFTQPRAARRAGLRRSHLTYYFPTRDDLLFAVVDEAVRRRVLAMAAVQDPSEPEQKLSTLAGVLASAEQTRVLLALAQSADQYDAVRASFDVLAREIAPLGASLLEAFDVEVDESSIALLQATSTGIAVLALARGADDAMSLARHLLAEFLAGQAARSTAGRRSAGHT